MTILHDDYKKDANKTILSRDGKAKGTVTNLTQRHCAGCGSIRLV